MPIAPTAAIAWDQPRSRGLIASSKPIGDSPASVRADTERSFACTTDLVGSSEVRRVVLRRPRDPRRPTAYRRPITAWRNPGGRRAIRGLPSARPASGDRPIPDVRRRGSYNTMPAGVHDRPLSIVTFAYFHLGSCWFLGGDWGFGEGRWPGTLWVPSPSPFTTRFLSPLNQHEPRSFWSSRNSCSGIAFSFIDEAPLWKAID